jgi:hypothetical protein
MFPLHSGTVLAVNVEKVLILQWLVFETTWPAVASYPCFVDVYLRLGTVSVQISAASR